MKQFILHICLMLAVFFLPVHSYAQARVEAEITSLQGNTIIVESDGKTYPVTLFDERQVGAQNLTVGDRVIISFVSTPEGGEQAIIVDHVRRIPLFVLAGIFVCVVILIGRGKGVLSLLAMAISFLIIGRLILPQILLGNDPIIISLIGALFIIPVLFYISHGFNWKTTIAVSGTFFALIVTAILAVVFVHFSKLTGFAAEEATFIQASGQQIDIRNLLLAGIIIGAMGVLDDITVSQTAIVEKLLKANPQYKKTMLFREAMDVGRDHIASLVNTLVLVYAGAALPLFVLFYSSTFTYSEVINMEQVATEIVRTLVSSIGIVLAVPLTTLIAVWQSDKLKVRRAGRG